MFVERCMQDCIKELINSGWTITDPELLDTDRGVWMAHFRKHAERGFIFGCYETYYFLNASTSQALYSYLEEYVEVGPHA